MNWKDAPAARVICYCKNITKAEIIRAITNGARNLDDIRRMTSACTGTKCETRNPSGKCCGGEIVEMLSYYAPVAEALRWRDVNKRSGRETDPPPES